LKVFSLQPSAFVLQPIHAAPPKTKVAATPSSLDMFIREHSVKKIEEKLTLDRGGIADAGAMEVALTPDQKFSDQPAPPQLDPEKKRAASLVPLLRFGEQLLWKRQPEHPFHGG
jgi:hypothetical protein